MESEYDPESEANAAMKLAVGAHGLERQKWFDLAIAWRELARGQPARQPHKTNVEAAAQSGQVARGDRTLLSYARYSNTRRHVSARSGLGVRGDGLCYQDRN
jgi:hypothetical protein